MAGVLSGGRFINAVGIVVNAFPFTQDRLSIVNVIPFFYKNKDKHI